MYHKNLKYPKNAKKKGIIGRVYVEFIVERDGTINNESVRALTTKEVSEFIPNTSNIIQDKECELEALRLVQESPNWSPGKIKSVPARQKMVLPIIFK
jgi:protein TonB